MEAAKAQNWAAEPKGEKSLGYNLSGELHFDFYQ
jgi:hypothetical protein